MSTSSSGMSRLQSVRNFQPVNNISATSTQPQRLNESKSPYQVDQQVKFLHLQAEVECLLQQLQVLQQRRIAADGSEQQ